jgi:hypothetical protein
VLDVVDDLAHVRTLTNNSRIHDFATFLMQERGEKVFPTFDLDALMRVPQLVPNIFAYDFREGVDDGLKVIHAGTAVDAEYGYNVTGTTFEIHYPGDDSKEEVAKNYRRVFFEGKKFYSYRTIRMQKDEMSRYRTGESLMFPCSSNRTDIDFGWGFIMFEPAEKIVENSYILW